MDARQNDLLKARSDHASHLRHDILRPSAAHPASGIGDCAIGAELIAAVLDLNVRPRVLRCLMKLHLFILVGVVDVQNRRAAEGFVRGALLRRMLFKIFLEDVHNILLAVIADAKVYAFILFKSLSAGLDIAADGDDNRLRIQLLRPVQHLPAFSVRYVRHRTGIHNINVRHAVKWHNAISAFL